jgi:hypothetical protein
MTTIAERSPRVAIRAVGLAVLWLVAGVFCYYNYVTDACPPEVERREAILHGLIAPLSLAAAAGSAPCVHTVGLRAFASYGYLLAWLALTFCTFRARKTSSLVCVVALLIGLYIVGGRCLIYMNDHGYS